MNPEAFFPELPEDEADKGIHFFCEDVPMPLNDEDNTRRWLEHCASEEGRPIHTLQYIFCSDEHLLGINREYLDHDYYTDIITFPYSDTAAHADLYISTERVRDHAQERGIPFAHELHRVMVHGLLHLLGYDDKSPDLKAAMSAREDHYLAKADFF